METDHRKLIQEGGRIMLQARLRRSCTAIMDNTTHEEDGLTCGDSQHGQIELWSGGTPTANDCTQAMGVDTDSEAYNYSSQVC